MDDAPYDSAPETLKHIDQVDHYISEVRNRLYLRGAAHDQSKLQDPEKETFDRMTPRLANLEYGSPEYKASLEELGPALQHHYENNSHHPEHWPNGINDMSLLDIIEMLCDWKAASLRTVERPFIDSLTFNIHRFNLDPQLGGVLINTAKELGFV